MLSPPRKDKSLLAASLIIKVSQDEKKKAGVASFHNGLKLFLTSFSVSLRPPSPTWNAVFVRLSQAFVLARLYAKCPAQVYENGDNVLLWQTYLQTVWTAARREFAVKISWCNHSNEISSVALLHHTTLGLSHVEPCICGHFWKEMVTVAFSILHWYLYQADPTLNGHSLCPGGSQRSFIRGTLRPEVQPLTFLYTIFDRKATPSYTFYSPMVPPFTYLG